MRERTTQSLTAWLFLLPGLAGLALFFLLPFGSIVYLSLTNWDLYRPPQWTALDNFAALARDAAFRTALGQTLTVVGLAVPLSLVAGLALALLVGGTRRSLPGASLFRALYFVPAVLYTVALAAVVDLIFRLALEVLGGRDGAPVVALLQRHELVAALVLVTAFKWTGFVMVVVLAGLRQIPPELDDAARVDGAGGWQRLRYVTLPQLAPSLLFAATMTTILTATAFDQGAVLGTARRSASMIVVFVFDRLFGDVGVPRGGYAAAAALVLAVLLAGAAAIQARVLRRWLSGATEGVE